MEDAGIGRGNERSKEIEKTIGESSFCFLNLEICLMHRVKSVYQRAGYLLSLYQEQLGLTNAFFEHCKKWKICVPNAIRGIKS